jgi:hypothetical protein
MASLWNYNTKRGIVSNNLFLHFVNENELRWLYFSNFTYSAGRCLAKDREGNGMAQTCVNSVGRSRLLIFCSNVL